MILPTAQYESKIEEFIQTNNFQTSMINPTKSFQSQVRKVINNGITLIPSDTKWKHKYEPHRTIHQRVNETTQTQTLDSSSGQLARSPSLQISPSIYPDYQTDDLTTQHKPPREHQRPNQENLKTPQYSPVVP